MQQAPAAPMQQPLPPPTAAEQAAFFGAGGFFSDPAAADPAMLGELGGALEDDDLLPPEEDLDCLEEDLQAFDFANMPGAQGGAGEAGRNVEQDVLGLLDDNEGASGSNYQWDFGGGVKAPEPTAMPGLVGTTDIQSGAPLMVPARRSAPPGFGARPGRAPAQGAPPARPPMPPPQPPPQRAMEPGGVTLLQPPARPPAGPPAAPPPQQQQQQQQQAPQLLAPGQWGAQPAAKPRQPPPPRSPQQQAPLPSGPPPASAAPPMPRTPPPAGAPRAPGAPRGPGLGPRLYVGGGGLQGGSMMAPHEVEQIARIQYAATHQRGAYQEDYYALALAAKSGGQKPGLFAPAVLREQGGANGVRGGGNVAHVALDGLGKIVYSSISKPKPMLEIPPREGEGIGADAEEPAEDDAAEGEAAEARPLEQEPMLAARQLVEDGHSLLLDVDDIDRVLATPPLPADGGAMLKGRRAAMLDQLIASLRLPPPGAPLAEHLPPASTAADRVLARVGAVAKGRALLAGALTRLAPEAPAAVSLAVAACRNLGALLGARRARCPAASRLAMACARCVAKMEPPMLVACLAATQPKGLWAKHVAGDEMGDAPSPPGEALVMALLACAPQVCGSEATRPAWTGAMERYAVALAQLPPPGAPRRALEAALASAEGAAADALKALAARAPW